jgi:predicted membrane protein
MNPETEPRPNRAVTPALVIGIAIILFGLGLTLDNFDFRFQYMHYVFRFWPVVLIAVGLLKLRACHGTCVGGYLLTGAGFVLLLKTAWNMSIGDFIGPMIVMGVGIFIVLRALKQHRQVPPELQQSEGFLRGNAILSAFKHRHQSQAFRGGELTSIFGGFEVDLRQALIEGPSARLDTFIMFGGGDLRVPEGWEVVVQATAIFGGVNDKTAPLPMGTEGRPRLVITGLVLFGGIEIRH